MFIPITIEARTLRALQIHTTTMQAVILYSASDDMTRGMYATTYLTRIVPPFCWSLPFTITMIVIPMIVISITLIPSTTTNTGYITNFSKVSASSLVFVPLLKQSMIQTAIPESSRAVWHIMFTILTDQTISFGLWTKFLQTSIQLSISNIMTVTLPTNRKIPHAREALSSHILKYLSGSATIKLNAAHKTNS